MVVTDQVLVTLDAGGILVARDVDTGDRAGLVDADRRARASRRSPPRSRWWRDQPRSRTSRARPRSWRRTLAWTLDSIAALLETDAPEVVLDGWIDSDASSRRRRPHRRRHACGHLGRRPAGGRGLDRPGRLVPGCRHARRAGPTRPGPGRRGHGVGRQRSGRGASVRRLGHRTAEHPRRGRRSAAEEHRGDAGRHHRHRLERAHATRPRGRLAARRHPDHLCRRPARQLGVHGCAAAVHARGRGRRYPAGPTQPGPDAAPGARRRRRDGQRRHRRQRLGLSIAGRADGRGDRCLPVPAGADALPAPIGWPVRGRPGHRGGDAVRQLPDRHERRLRDGLPGHGADPVRAGLAGQLAQTLAGPAGVAHRGCAAGACARLQVGGRVRHRRLRAADAAPVRAGPAHRARRDDRRDRRPGGARHPARRRARPAPELAVPGHHAAADARPRGRDRPAAAAPDPRRDLGGRRLAVRPGRWAPSPSGWCSAARCRGGRR